MTWWELSPILLIIAGVLFIGVLMNRARHQAERARVEEASRKRVRAEFAAIRQHRPTHIVGISKWLMDGDTNER